MNIGLIAGGGQFPSLFTQRAKEKGYRVIAAGFRSDTDQNLPSLVHEFQWLHIGQINKLLKFFRRHGVTQAVMLGSIEKATALKNVRPDLKALAFIAKTKKTLDDSLLSSFAALMEQEGIEIKASTFLLPELLSPSGCWTQKQPDKNQMSDIHQGWKLAKAIGDLDIGQCIVINNGSVLAVEAIDGTDATIRRGGGLSRGQGAVLVKLSKPHQDLRFDVPASGCTTIDTMVESGVNVLALEAEKSLSFDREAMIQKADENGICIVALTDGDIP